MKVNRRGFAIKSSVHIESCNPIFGRNVVFAVRIGHVLDEFDDFSLSGRVFVPKLEIRRGLNVNSGNFFARGGIRHAERAESY